MSIPTKPTSTFNEQFTGNEPFSPQEGIPKRGSQDIFEDTSHKKIVDWLVIYERTNSTQVLDKIIRALDFLVISWSGNSSYHCGYRKGRGLVASLLLKVYGLTSKPHFLQQVEQVFIPYIPNFDQCPYTCNNFYDGRGGVLFNLVQFLQYRREPSVSKLLSQVLRSLVADVVIDRNGHYGIRNIGFNKGDGFGYEIKGISEILQVVSHISGQTFYGQLSDAFQLLPKKGLETKLNVDVSHFGRIQNFEGYLKNKRLFKSASDTPSSVSLSQSPAMDLTQESLATTAENDLDEHIFNSVQDLLKGTVQVELDHALNFDDLHKSFFLEHYKISIKFLREYAPTKFQRCFPLPEELHREELKKHLIEKCNLNSTGIAWLEEILAFEEHILDLHFFQGHDAYYEMQELIEYEKGYETLQRPDSEILKTSLKINPQVRIAALSRDWMTFFFQHRPLPEILTGDEAVHSIALKLQFPLFSKRIAFYPLQGSNRLLLAYENNTSPNILVSDILQDEEMNDAQPSLVRSMVLEKTKQLISGGFLVHENTHNDLYKSPYHKCI